MILRFEKKIKGKVVCEWCIEWSGDKERQAARQQRKEQKMIAKRIKQVAKEQAKQPPSADEVFAANFDRFNGTPEGQIDIPT